MQGSFPALEIKPRAHGGARMMMKDTEGIVAVALFALAIVIIVAAVAFVRIAGIG
jgi:hypothetical protein